MNLHIDIVKAQMEATRRRVIELTGLSEDAISKMLFESAFEWLAYQGCDDYIAGQFANTKEFWGFWKYDIWYQADRAFIRQYYRYNYDPCHCRYYYECFHAVQSQPMNTDMAAAGYHSLIKKLAIKR